MENNTTATINAGQSDLQSGKKTYQSPKLKHYGSLAEIVQSQAGGADDSLAPTCSAS